MLSSMVLLMAAVFSLFLLLIILPMVPMLNTIHKKKDVNPLYMDMDYVFDPKFQSNHFEETLKAEEKHYEKVLIEMELRSSDIPKKAKLPIEFLSYGDVNVDAVVKQEAILFTPGAITMAPRSVITALKSGDKITLQKGSRVNSWIDATGELDIHESTEINLATAKSVKLHKGAKFKRIYADTIGVYPLNKEDENKAGKEIEYEKYSENVEADILYVNHKESIEKGSKIHSDVICRGDLKIEEGCMIFGSVKANGKLKILNNNKIYGNVFSDGNMLIHHHCFIFGNLFSHKYIKIGHNNQIGKYSAPKSLIGIKGIEIAGGTFIHNYILTYGKGEII